MKPTSRQRPQPWAAPAGPAGREPSCPRTKPRQAVLWCWLLLSPVAALAARSPIQSGPWSGAITPSSAVIKAQLRQPNAEARLWWSTNAGFAPRTSVQPEADSIPPSAVCTFRLHALRPDTLYYFAIEVNRQMAGDQRGTFRTFPQGRASFTFAFGSCAKTGSEHEVFKTIRRNDPLFFLHTGDFHYENIGSDNVGAFRAAYERVLASRTQSWLYRYVPLAYVWDDHDFGGNNSDGAAESRRAARAAYQEYVPHYPLEAGRGDVPIYQAFTVGQVRFILTDLRSERTPSREPDGPGKSMLGEPQMAWFKAELLSARERHPLIFWVSSVPWNGEYGLRYYPLPTNVVGHAHHQARAPGIATGTTVWTVAKPARSGHQDHWSAYARERREIADYLKAHQITGVCILHGDAHMLAADDGTNSDYATGGGMPIPVLAAAPLDQTPSSKGGPYSQGIYLRRPGEGCFGLVRVTDLDRRIRVSYSARNHLNQEKISLQFEVPAE